MYNFATHDSSTPTTFGTNKEGAFVTMDPSRTSALFGVTGVVIERINLSTNA